MDEKRVGDEFSRIELVARLEKERAIMSQYESGLAHMRRRVERTRYEMGHVDERLGVTDAER